MTQHLDRATLGLMGRSLLGDAVTDDLAAVRRDRLAPALSFLLAAFLDDLTEHGEPNRERILAKANGAGDMWSAYLFDAVATAPRLDEARVQLADALLATAAVPKILCLEDLNPTMATDLIASDMADPESLIDGLFYPGTVLVIGAQVKMHKTWFAIQLALSGVSGADFLGHAIRRKLRVLYIGGEGSPRSIRKRLLLAVGYIPGLQDGDLDNLGIVSSLGRVKLDTPAGEDWLQRVSEGYDVVIIDPYYRFLSVGSENDHADQRAIQDVFDRLKAKGKAIVIVHHLRKPQGVDSGAAELRGAGLDAFADTILLLFRRKSGGAEKRFNLKYILRHDEEPDDLELSLNGPLLQVATPAPPAVTAEDLIDAIIQGGGAMSATDLKRVAKESTDAAKHEVDEAIVSALKDKKIGWRPKPGRGQGRMYFVR